MEASRQNWIAEQHASAAVLDTLAGIPALELPHGAILALALPEDVTEEKIKAALGDSYDILFIKHAPETHDRFVHARRVFKAKKIVTP